MKMVMLMFIALWPVAAWSGPMKTVESYHALNRNLPPFLNKIAENEDIGFQEKDLLIKTVIYSSYLEILTGKTLKDHRKLLDEYSWFSGDGFYLLPLKPDSVVKRTIRLKNGPQGEQKAFVCWKIMAEERFSSMANFQLDNLRSIYDDYRVIRPNYDTLYAVLNILENELGVFDYEMRAVSRITAVFELRKVGKDWKICRIRYDYENSALDLKLPEGLLNAGFTGQVP